MVFKKLKTMELFKKILTSEELPPNDDSQRFITCQKNGDIHTLPGNWINNLSEVYLWWLKPVTSNEVLEGMGEIDEKTFDSLKERHVKIQQLQRNLIYDFVDKQLSIPEVEKQASAMLNEMYEKNKDVNKQLFIDDIMFVRSGYHIYADGLMTQLTQREIDDILDKQEKGK